MDRRRRGGGIRLRAGAEARRDTGASELIHQKSDRKQHVSLGEAFILRILTFMLQIKNRVVPCANSNTFASNRRMPSTPAWSSTAAPWHRPPLPPPLRSLRAGSSCASPFARSEWRSRWRDRTSRSARRTLTSPSSGRRPRR